MAFGVNLPPKRGLQRILMAQTRRTGVPAQKCRIISR